MTQLLIIACLLLLAFYKNQRDLHMFQQNSYRSERYMKWRNTQKKTHGYDFALAYAALFFYSQIIFETGITHWILLCFGFAFMAVSAFGFKLHIDASPQKKKLVYTDRVKRLNITIGLIYMICFLCFLLVDIPFLMPTVAIIMASSLIVLFSYGVMLVANWLNKPIENHINKGFITDAKRRLKENPNLVIIGITGSYGKTSVKNILYQLLSQRYNVLMTPESYNTLLGVTRTITEQLLPTHEILIVEMGAKQSGDIKEICDLVNPHIGIITSIGPQHLDTFKTIETVQSTKGELFQGVRENGKIYMNFNDDLIMRLAKRSDVDITYFGLENEGQKPPKNSAHYLAKDIQLNKKGTHFTCASSKGNHCQMTTRLLGAHNIGNMIGSIAIAGDLGIQLQRLNTLLYDIEPVKHRLSYRTTGMNYTIIDDAFNSNPVGSKNALKVLKEMKGNKKIIITPGMIELGDQQYDLNKAFGHSIAKSCDYTILVGPKQTKPIQDGLSEANYPKEQLSIAENLKAAFATLNQIVAEGDIVLLENDLPDAFNE